MKLPSGKKCTARAMAAGAVLAILVTTSPSHADEGMWTWNAFPRERVRARYGFAPDDAWLRHTMLASLRLAGGCSAAFVSGDGLVLTNHHCAHACIEQLSTAKRDYVKTGFHARTLADEQRCPEMELNQLLEISDVTARMERATHGLQGAAFHDAHRAERARIEKECQTSAALRCEVVALYHGGLYQLYRYRRFQDVRLVFAPEFAIAFFGGDPDNFEFPRWDLDFAFLRVHADDGRPAKTDDYLSWSFEGARDGDLTFVAGNPGETQRQLTVAELEYQRDVALPDRLLWLAEMRGVLFRFSEEGAEPRRIANELLFAVENSLKALRGRLDALGEPPLMQRKAADEKALRLRVDQNPALKKDAGGAWDAIAAAQAKLRLLRKQLAYQERAQGMKSVLFSYARTLVRGAEELKKPSEQRLEEYKDPALPALEQQLFSTAPIYPALETLTLAFSLRKMREELGPDDPFVRKVLGRESPEDAAARLVRGTRLASPALRRQLWRAGDKSLRDSKDPMIQLALAIDGDARAVRRRFETEIEPVIRRAKEAIARARFQLEGTSSYPDATFTPRLSYGQVAGYQEGERTVAPTTTLGGAFERATGRPPFALPDNWLRARSRLALDTPFNFCTTNDIVGGNSGSPVFNQRAELVGLIFDGNIQSLGGEYAFDLAQNRAVAVESVAIVEALEKIYDARRLVAELKLGGLGD